MKHDNHELACAQTVFIGEAKPKCIVQLPWNSSRNHFLGIVSGLTIR